MTTVRHADPSYNGMVFVGAGVLDFVDGTAEPDFNVTDREAATLAGFGFTVGDGPDLAKHDDEAESDLAGMTVADLKAHAAELGIDLGGARTKADIVKAIEG